jgi:ribonucleoside-diphosphate reductase alpha chain
MKKIPKKIRKRNGSLAALEPGRIERAVFRASFTALNDEKKAAANAADITERVLEKIARQSRGRIPDIEKIQDIVEETLIDRGLASIAKSYILYRKARQDLRHTKTVFGIRDDLKLPVNSLLVLKKRYLLKDDNNNVTETPGELFKRVAKTVSQAELNFTTKQEQQEIEEAFLKMMAGLELLPNSPTLMNAGTSIGQLSACFVLPIEDSLETIFETVKNTALIHRTGGGTGFDFSRIRPRGALVSTTKGRASGPVSFMSIFNQTTDVIIQGGRRRGANMGILRCDHPDIFEFAEVKLGDGAFANFNLSVAITDKFINAVKRDGPFDLINPLTKKKVRTIKAKALFDLIAFSAWRTGDPGLIFIDEINRHNPTPKIGKIEATNPCSEVLLLPYESCNLASINLSAMVRNRKVDWQKLEKNIRLGIRFLDNVLEVNKYPLPQIRDITLANRKVGLGVMGFADMLIKLGIPYNNSKAEALARKVMRFIRRHSFQASQELAVKRGPFPNIDKSIYFKNNLAVRNATLNAIAPTGTISIIAGCSSGIEPLFSLSHIRTVMGGTKLIEIHPLFEQELEQRGLYSKGIMTRIRKGDSIQKAGNIPAELKSLFVTSFDVSSLEHLKIQAAFQKHTDNSVSKTINLPHDATVDDVRNIYLFAHKMKCKGITVYRYGSKPDQVLSFDPESEEENAGPLTAASPGGDCLTGQCNF